MPLSWQAITVENTGKLEPLDCAAEGSYDVAFSPVGSLLATASDNGLRCIRAVQP